MCALSAHLSRPPDADSFINLPFVLFATFSHSHIYCLITWQALKLITHYFQSVPLRPVINFVG